MKMLSIKLMVFTLIYVVLQAFISYATMPKQIKNMKKYLAGHIDVIYFGDSVISFSPYEDTDRESIVEKVKKISKGYTVEAVDHEAYNMDVYCSYMRLVLSKKERPKCVVIPINLASFSREYLRPNYQFDIERAILDNNNPVFDVFYRPMEIFRKQSVSQNEYMNADVYNGDKVAGKVRDFDNSSYAVFSPDNFNRKIIFRYMYNLNGTETKVLSLKKLLKLCEGSGIKLIFYVTPVDYMSAGKSFGSGFKKQVDHNVAFLGDIIRKSNAAFVDMTYSLPADVFGWKQHMYIFEHLNAVGRGFVAEKINAEIERQLNKAAMRQ